MASASRRGHPRSKAWAPSRFVRLRSSAINQPVSFGGAIILPTRENAMLRTLVAALLIAAAPVAAEDRNPLIDYAGFQQLTKDVSAYRHDRLLKWEEFKKAGRQPRTLILDARSADAYAAGHIKGAVNL